MDIYYNLNAKKLELGNEVIGCLSVSDSLLMTHCPVIFQFIQCHVCQYVCIFGHRTSNHICTSLWLQSHLVSALTRKLEPVKHDFTGQDPCDSSHLQCSNVTEMHLFWREFDILYSECIVLQVFCKVLLKLYFRTVCFCGKCFVEPRQFVCEMTYNVCVFV